MWTSSWHDPYLDPSEAEQLGAHLVSLPELAALSDVVTLHAPNLPETRHLINAEIFQRMRPGTVFINTARGAIVDTDALTAAVAEHRIRAVLDVTDPEPLPPQHPLWDLPGVVLTPHVAGSLGTEVRRLGVHAVSETARALAGHALRTPVDAAMLNRSA